MLPSGPGNLDTETQSVRDSETCRTGGDGKMVGKIWPLTPWFSFLQGCPESHP
jgi:hypothetical protein